MTTQNPYASATLYVGDLSPEVTEATLFEVFNAIGPVASIRVCRDVSTRTSLGYAYVNFHSVTSAERALETLNYCKIKGRPCRIMWSQRDKQLRESGKGNIFVKNLHESIDNKTLQDTFRVFGPILSCTVVTDPETGASRGYGYVHFLQPEHAKKAIEDLKGTWIAGKQIHSERFVPRQERLKQTLWTNVYFKHIPGKMTEEDLKKFVEEKTGGKVTCSHMWEKPTFGKSACLNFESHEMAAKCVETLNKYDMKDLTDEKDNEGKPIQLYVARSQKRSERDRILKKNARRPRSRQFTSPSNNLYVKPLGAHVTDDKLRELFSPFGSIVSAKVMTSNDGQSRGFGFVCFHDPENAAQALAKLHGSVIDGAKMYVSRAQKKEDRQQYLATRGRRSPSRRYGYGNAPSSSQASFHNPPPPQMGGYYSYPRPGMPPPQAQMHAAQFNQGQMPRQPYPFNPMGQMPMQMPMSQMGMPMTQMGQMPMNMNFGGFAGMRPPNAAFGGMQQPHAGMQVHPQPSNSAAVAGGIPGNAAMRGGMGSVGVIPQSGVVGVGGIRGPSGGVSASAGASVGTGVSAVGVPVTNYSQPTQAATTAPAQHTIYSSAGQTGIEPSSGGQSRPIQSFPSQLSATERETQPLTLQMLQGATGQERKRMIGERLFPKIQEVEPRLAGKITGMLLEMENTELLILLTNKEQLRKKINEALSVLKEHTKKQSLRNSESRAGSQSNQSASNRQGSVKT